MEGVEATRARFRPERIATLFVGESAPAGGDFFYYGNSGMTRYMRRAMESALGESSDFLERFKSYGWYLDDLVLTPVNDLTKSEREAKCRDALSSLATRIEEYRPQAIVSLLFKIKNIVDAAATMARCNAPRFAVPFPGNGQQTRFHAAMVSIVPKLPRAGLRTD
jgi:hypothetical protein